MKRSSQGPLTIWHGVDLPRYAQLFSLRPPMSFRMAGRLTTLPMLAAYNSLMKGVEALTHGAKVRRATIHDEPLFIVGHWRSGTTLLHNLVCQDEQFGFPNLYQCLFPHHFLATEKIATPLTGWMLPKSRPMDNVPCGWDLPQEDEIAICMLSLLGPYRMMAFMDQPEKYIDQFDPQDMTADELETLRQTILYFMRKLSVRCVDDAGQPKPLCMKSPSHTYRVGLLSEMFPKARFLYIHRDPYDVYNSTRHLRRTMWAENGFAPSNTVDDPEMTLNVYKHAIETYERDKSLVPAGRLHEIRYSDLAADPVGVLGDAYEAVGLDGFDDLAATLAPQVPKITSYKGNQFTMPLDEQRFVYENAHEIFERYGYPSRLERDDEAAVA